MNYLYIVASWVPRREEILVGSLGPITFERGWHVYVGSARRGRNARVARHMRADKPLRWHADYLFARYPATRAWLVDMELTECELTAVLREQAGERQPQSLAHFGASDCGCRGHLVAFTRLADLVAACRSAGRGGEAAWRPRRPAPVSGG